MGFWEFVLAFIVALIIAPFVWPVIVTFIGLFFVLIAAISAAIAGCCDVIVKKIHKTKKGIKEKWNGKGDKTM